VSATFAKRGTETGDHSILIVCQNYAERSVPSRHPQATLGGSLSIFRTTIRTQLTLLRKQLRVYKDSLHISATKTTVRRCCNKGSQNKHTKRILRILHIFIYNTPFLRSFHLDESITSSYITGNLRNFDATWHAENSAITTQICSIQNVLTQCARSHLATSHTPNGNSV